MQAVALAAASAALLAAPPARADGDPASDVLPAADVFLPIPAPSKAESALLRSLVGGANSGGNRLKVAVVASRYDLGSVPSLYGRPGAYARFLGTELGMFYSGVLLVVMPSGFGLAQGGGPAPAAEAALDGLAAPGRGADALAAAAGVAVQRLVAAKVLHYVDRLPPIVYAEGGASIQYAVADDSGKAAVTVTILSKGSPIAVIARPLAAVNPAALYAVRWRPPHGVHGLRYCVTAVDPSGNRSKPACAPLSNPG
jgi:hypothetical protein